MQPTGEPRYKYKEWTVGLEEKTLDVSGTIEDGMGWVEAWSERRETERGDSGVDDYRGCEERGFWYELGGCARDRDPVSRI